MNTQWYHQGCSIDYSQVGKEHSAEEWQAFWEQRVRPKFVKSETIKAKRAVGTKERSPMPPVVDAQPSTKPIASVKVRDDPQSSRRGPSRDEQPQKLGSTAPTLTSVVQTDGTALTSNEEELSPLGNSILKRKRPVAEEIPSSSPPSVRSPPSTRLPAKKIKEVASTPDQSPRRHDERRNQPRSLGEMLEMEANEALRYTQDGARSPLGRQPSETLSEPDRFARGSTQALLRSATPHIDFEVPLPEGGWGTDEDADQADKSESASEYDMAPEQAPAEDTQAILRGKTQSPDLSIANPDEPWEALIPPSSPPLIMPSSPAASQRVNLPRYKRTTSSAMESMLLSRISGLDQEFSAEQDHSSILNCTCTDLTLVRDKFSSTWGRRLGTIKVA